MSNEKECPKCFAIKQLAVAVLADELASNDADPENGELLHPAGFAGAMTEDEKKEYIDQAEIALSEEIVSAHISKKALREWCESYLVAIGHKQCNAYTIREATVLYDILEKFCKEGE
jgi:hypothetical protein